MLTDDVTGEITCDFEDLFAVGAFVAVCRFLMLFKRFGAFEKRSLAELACKLMGCIVVFEERVNVLEVIPAFSAIETVDCVLV